MGTYGTALALVGTQVSILPLMLLLKIGDSWADFAAAAVISLMLLDVLSGLPELQLCTSYQRDGRIADYFPADALDLEQCQPQYETLPGWSEDITAARKLTDLPAAARRYVDRIAELIGKPIAYVSVGPDRDQTIPVQ